ncbi:hypothetical protein TIFTF001_008162 [Ficus carica]|uniref:Uncharacterized protein n=1 Tax=Ficus carica TaxID=3494 RepID=A0AA88AEL9_FICCA|nr:hypothetical protein TIFTF001_008162 [Ficus carica]
MCFCSGPLVSWAMVNSLVRGEQFSSRATSMAPEISYWPLKLLQRSFSLMQPWSLRPFGKLAIIIYLLMIIQSGWIKLNFDASWKDGEWWPKNSAGIPLLARENRDCPEWRAAVDFSSLALRLSSVQSLQFNCIPRTCRSTADRLCKWAINSRLPGFITPGLLPPLW